VRVAPSVTTHTWEPVTTTRERRGHTPTWGCSPPTKRSVSISPTSSTSSRTHAPNGPFRSLLVSPNFLLPTLLAHIERESEHARAGRPARIRAKLNGLSDAKVVDALYRASRAGVEIDLIIRSLCTLRPGVPDLSERIRVISGLGRFLEHARVYHFGNGGDDEYYIGSADWRPRNLRRRVEVVAPIRDADARARLDRILEVELADPTAWELGPEGGYVRRSGAEGPGAQERFAMEAADAAPVA
jgi:polyphosphate kinase